jgi:glycosyltransferase involved in cell wall biosynthesis
MTTQPDVTILLYTRDRLPGLRHALASIGDDPTAEILVIDDHSRDGTRDWLAALADPRVSVLPGGGMGRARGYNLGIAAAQAPLVAFLEPGDHWHPGKLGQQRALHAGHPAIALSFTDATLLPSAGAPGGSALAAWPRFQNRHRGAPSAFLLGDDGLAQLCAENVAELSTVVARTDLLRETEGFAFGLNGAAEWDLWLRLAARASVACLPTTLATISRTHRGGAVPRVERSRGADIAARQLGALAAAARGGGARMFAAALRLHDAGRAPDGETDPL